MQPSHFHGKSSSVGIAKHDAVRAVSGNTKLSLGPPWNLRAKKSFVFGKLHVVDAGRIFICTGLFRCHTSSDLFHTRVIAAVDAHNHN